jgi:hypothetical protein
MNQTDLQLTLALAQAPRPVYRRRRPPQRATWWFSKMRQVVDNAEQTSPAISIQMQANSVFAVSESR